MPDLGFPEAIGDEVDDDLLRLDRSGDTEELSGMACRVPRNRSKALV
jgi:hypothetical protein